MVADIKANDKLIPIVTELLRSRIVFISRFYFKVPKNNNNKRDTTFYYQNTYQKTTPTNSIKLFF